MYSARFLDKKIHKITAINSEAQDFIFSSTKMRPSYFMRTITFQGFSSPRVGSHGFTLLKVNEQYWFCIYLCFFMRRMPQLSVVSEKGL